MSTSYLTIGVISKMLRVSVI